MLDQRRIFINDENGEQSIICPCCHQSKSVAQFYIVKRNKNGERGFSAWCRSCIHENKKSKIDKRIKFDETTGYNKIHCTSCDSNKILSDFYKVNYQYSKICKACSNRVIYYQPSLEAAE